MPTSPELAPDAITWAELDLAVGREQEGGGQVLVVASRDYLDVINQLALVVTITSVDPGVAQPCGAWWSRSARPSP